MKKSESIANLASALCKFQGEVANPKNTADNPFFKSKYAPLNEVINTVKPLLLKHGLSVLQTPSGDGQNVIVTTLLMHSSGEWIEGEPLVLKADKATAQGAGSAISYGRRYALSAILGIASEEDDDGNHATGHDESGTKQGPSIMDHPKKGQGSKKGQDTEIEKFVCSTEGCGTTITKGIATVSKQKYGRELCMICQKKQTQIGAR